MKPKYKLFTIDDTRHWNLPDLPETSKILSVYLYDESSHTHCCELTPSYECRKLYSVLDDDSIGGKQHDLLMDLIDYNDNVGDISYYHCSFVDGLKRVEVEGDFDDIEEAIEYARCNDLIQEGK